MTDKYTIQNVKKLIDSDAFCSEGCCCFLGRAQFLTPLFNKAYGEGYQQALKDTLRYFSFFEGDI